jgi:hypothetical protein
MGVRTEGRTARVEIKIEPWSPRLLYYADATDMIHSPCRDAYIIAVACRCMAVTVLSQNDPHDERDMIRPPGPEGDAVVERDRTRAAR